MYTLCSMIYTYYTYEYVIIIIYVSADDMNFLSQGLCWEIRALSLSGGMNHSKRLFSRIPETQQTEKASEFKAWRHMKPDWHALHVMLSVTFSANVDESMTPDQCGFSPSTIWVASQLHNFIDSYRFNVAAASMESINFAKLRVSSRMLSSQKQLRSFGPKKSYSFGLILIPPPITPKGWWLGFCRETWGTPQKRALQNEIPGGATHYKIRTQSRRAGVTNFKKYQEVRSTESESWDL